MLAVDDVIGKVCEHFDKKSGEPLLKRVVGWKQEPRSNILKLLCEKGYERIATQYMSMYP